MQIVVLLRKLLLVPRLASFVSGGVSVSPLQLTLPELVLYVCDQALLRAIVGIAVHHGVDGLEVVGLAHWGRRLAPSMVGSPTVQVVVRLLIT